MGIDESSVEGHGEVGDEMARWAGRDIGTSGRMAAARLAADYNAEPVVVGGEPIGCAEFIRLAVSDAIAAEREFSTPYAAARYLAAVVQRCRDQECRPGEFPTTRDTRKPWQRERDEARKAKLAAVRKARQARKG